MGLDIDNGSESDINSLITEMYKKLLHKRLEFSEIRQKGNKDKIEKAMAEIENLNEDFNGLIKMQIQYNKFLKTNGKSTNDDFPEMRDLIAKIRSNVGSIVSQIPKANPDVI